MLAEAARPLPFERVLELVPVLDPQQLQEIAAWSDDLSLQKELGLPGRFRPRIENGAAQYRYSDVLDLLLGLGKTEEQSWEEWRAGLGNHDAPLGKLVQLRMRESALR